MKEKKQIENYTLSARALLGASGGRCQKIPGDSTKKKSNRDAKISSAAGHVTSWNAGGASSRECPDKNADVESDDDIAANSGVDGMGENWSTAERMVLFASFVAAVRQLFRRRALSLQNRSKGGSSGRSDAIVTDEQVYQFVDQVAYTDPKLRRDWMFYLSHRDKVLLDQHMVAMMVAWLEFDTDGSGDLSSGELRQLVSSLNMPHKMEMEMHRLADAFLKKEKKCGFSFYHLQRLYESVLDWVELENYWFVLREGFDDENDDMGEKSSRYGANTMQIRLFLQTAMRQVRATDADAAALQLMYGGVLTKQNFFKWITNPIINGPHTDYLGYGNWNYNALYQQYIKRGSNCANFGTTVQDMSHSLAHYFILSASSTTSLDVLTRSLLAGCRFVEIDVWDGAAVDYDDQALICPPPQGAMANTRKRKQREEAEKNKRLKKKQDRRKQRRQRLDLLSGGHGQSKQDPNSDSDMSDTEDDDEKMNRRRKEEAARVAEVLRSRPVLPTFEEAMRRVNDDAFTATEYPLILRLNLHPCVMRNQLLQRLMVQQMKSIFAAKLAHRDDQTVSLLTPHMYKLQIFVHVCFVELEEHLPSVKSTLSGSSNTQGAMTTSEQHEFGSDRKISASNKNNNSYESLNAELMHLIDPYFKSLFFLETKLITQLNKQAIASRLPHETVTIHEQEALNLSKIDPSRWMAHNAYQLTRVIGSAPQRGDADTAPSNDRHNLHWTIPAFNVKMAYNLHPQEHWNHGCQIVAVNWSDPQSYELRLTRGFFLQNGNCGYVLKPPYLREGFQSSDTNLSTLRSAEAHKKNSRNRIRPVKIEIEVINGFCLPQSESGDEGSVRVSLHCEGPGCSRSDRHYTSALANRFHPVWKGAALSTAMLYVPRPELTTLILQVHHASDGSSSTSLSSLPPSSLSLNTIPSTMLADCFVPVIMLREGIRSFPLRTGKGNFLPQAFVMCSIRIHSSDF